MGVKILDESGARDYCGAAQRLCGVCHQIGQDTAADDSLWRKERAALRPNVAGTTPTEAEVEDRPAGVGQMRLRETCRCARTGATCYARRLACPR